MEDRHGRTDDRLGRPGEQCLVDIGLRGRRLPGEARPDRPDELGGVEGVFEAAVPALLLREMPEAGEQVGAIRGGHAIGLPGGLRRHAGEVGRLPGEDGRVGLVDEQRHAAEALGLPEDLRKPGAKLDPLFRRGLEIPPAVGIDRLRLLGVGQLGEGGGPPAVDRGPLDLPEILPDAGERVDHVVERRRRGGGIDVGRGGRHHRLERLRESLPLLAGGAGPILEPADNEAIPRRPGGALADEAHELLRRQERGEMLRLGGG